MGVKTTEFQADDVRFALFKESCYFRDGLQHLFSVLFFTLVCPVQLCFQHGISESRAPFAAESSSPYRLIESTMRCRGETTCHICHKVLASKACLKKHLVRCMGQRE